MPMRSCTGSPDAGMGIICAAQVCEQHFIQLHKDCPNGHPEAGLNQAMLGCGSMFRVQRQCGDSLDAINAIRAATWASKF